MIEAAAIIPAYNLSHVTIRCIDHLNWYAANFAKVLYYDNGSDAEHFAAVKARLDTSDLQFEIIRYKENMHFTYAVNNGWLKSLDLGLIPVVLNNDCFVTGNCLQNMVWNVVNRERVGACNPLTDGPGVCTIRKGSRPRRFGRALKLLPNWDAAAEHIQSAAGRREFSNCETPFFCTAINPDAIREVGLMFEKYRNGLWADNEWNQRAREAEWQTGIAANAFAIHKGRSSFTVLNIPRVINR